MSHVSGCVLRAAAVIVLCCAAACQKSHSHGQVGSESHFLACERSADCTELGEGYECRRGACMPIQRFGSKGVAGAELPRAGAGGASGGEPPPPAAGAPCEVETPFGGDERCLVPPASTAGLQIHLGPREYADPELDAWVLNPGDEVFECVSFHTANAEDAFYAEWEFSSRPGLHHAVVSLFDVEVTDGSGPCLNAGALEPGQLVSVLPSASEHVIQRRAVAPENESVGWPVPARASGQAQLHTFNFTDRPLLRDAWLNLYFAEQQPPVDTARALRLIGGLTSTVEPNSRAMLRFECPIASAGRLLSLTAFPLETTHHEMSVWLRRTTGERVHLLQTALGAVPTSYMYDTVTTHPAPADPGGGAHSGSVELEAGDALEWECHIVNEYPQPLTHADDPTLGGLCDLTGMAIGDVIDCALP